MPIDRPIDFDDAQQWAALFDELRGLKGKQRVKVWKERRKATHPQFGYYYGVVLPRAKQFLNDTQGGNEEGEDFTEDQADIWLKLELRPVANKHGEVMPNVVPSKAEWDTKQMAAFIDDVVDLLTKNGVKVPPPMDSAARQCA